MKNLKELTTEKINSLNAYMENVSIKDLIDNKDIARLLERRQELAIWKNVEMLLKEGMNKESINDRLIEFLLSEIRPSASISELISYKNVIREIKYCN